MADSEPDSELEALLYAVQAFRGLDPEIQAQTVATFLFIAMKNRPVLMQELTDAIDVSQASISRNVAVLSEVHRKGKAGHKLIEAWENPDNRRQKFVQLTQRGHMFVKTLRRALGSR